MPIVTIVVQARYCQHAGISAFSHPSPVFHGAIRKQIGFKNNAILRNFKKRCNYRCPWLFGLPGRIVSGCFSFGAKQLFELAILEKCVHFRGSLRFHFYFPCRRFQFFVHIDACQSRLSGLFSTFHKVGEIDRSVSPFAL